MKLLVKLLLAAGLLWGIGALALAIDRSLYVYPTPETQSTFLKTYNPTRVIEPFKSKANSLWQSGQDDAAGRKFATHHLDKKQYFAMTPEKMPVLFAAMKEDVLRNLAEQGAHVLQQTSDENRFEVSYELGQTRGLVAIDPPQQVDSNMIAGKAGLPPCDVAVMVDIRIGETWSKIQPQNRKDVPTLHNL